MANRSNLERAEDNLAERPRPADAAVPECGTRCPDSDARLFGRMKVQFARRNAGPATAPRSVAPALPFSNSSPHRWCGWSRRNASALRPNFDTIVLKAVRFQ
jgi:hypothetical protein